MGGKRGTELGDADGDEFVHADFAVFGRLVEAGVFVRKVVVDLSPLF